MEMNKLTTIQKLIAEKTVCILFIHGEDTEGNGMFAYTAVRADVSVHPPRLFLRVWPCKQSPQPPIAKFD